MVYVELTLKLNRIVVSVFNFLKYDIFLYVLNKVLNFE